MRTIVNRLKLHSMRGRGGQAMIEFMMVAGAVVLMCTIMGVFLYTFRENSGRAMEHVGSEYP